MRGPGLRLRSLQVSSYTRPALVVVGGLLLGWLVLATTMDRIFARRAPALALAWNSQSADANAYLADQMLQASPGAVDGRIAFHAARSLARQPVNPVAARLLAIVASQQRRERRAKHLLSYAEAMSRRDLSTQLLLIESSVARNDIAAALLHYNRALKSNNNARPLLFPILSSAAADPAVWQPLLRILDTRPQWGRPFLQQYVPSSTSPDALYAIARTLGMDRVPSSDPWLLQGVEKRLVDLKSYARAAALYNRAHGRSASDRTPLRNGGFEKPGSWDPFDWNLMDEQDLAALRQPSPAAADGLALFPIATNGRQGEVASQLMLLPPGRYTIDAKVGGVQGDPLAFPQLAVICAADGRMFVQAAFPSSPEKGRLWRQGMTIPADCPAERIVVRATSTLDGQPASPWIDSIVIRRQGER